ncbi:transcriptional regulator [Vibrio splendidus]|uniref:Helix-turn-helix transcriptional regulator n=1 Tax=Vibrio splendidus TaxID=29497 RepID=A0AB35MX81_VIBSP|nr:helix-turn-helix transcriptional regulator [Vibrio splendidus]MDP2501394.1 helix-turn-helix transcriptional regulator [Vibrio splendidus]PMM77679.1 transcriptional regulator [Vibrio splendidus]PMO00199.1 transcriptional regulator [Vibrio splendidus]
MNQLAKEIALNIKRHREKLNLSSTQLSLKAGFSRSYMNKVEKDGVRVTVEKLYMIARVLECDVNDLLPEDRLDLLDEG